MRMRLQEEDEDSKNARLRKEQRELEERGVVGNVPIPTPDSEPIIQEKPLDIIEEEAEQVESKIEKRAYKKKDKKLKFKKGK